MSENIFLKLRTSAGLSQEDLAEKLHVTRQAVSRWETEKTLPGPDVLKEISKLFDVSINTLLGSPRKLICQCCGMELDESSLSREPDGAFNESYCKWCYSNGEFVYKTKDDLLDFFVERFSSPEFTPEQTREYFDKLISDLDHWKKEA